MLIVHTSRGGQAILMPSASACPPRFPISRPEHASGSFTRTTVSPSPLLLWETTPNKMHFVSSRNIPVCSESLTRFSGACKMFGLVLRIYEN